MLGSNALQFSRFRSHEFERICQLLSSVFHTSPAELTALYKALDSTFWEEGWPPHFVPRGFFQTQDSQFQSLYERSPSIAIDLPSILEIRDKDQNKPTVVILGQDSKSSQSHDRISLGTPYGLHHKGSRELLSNTRLYFRMIQVLMELGYRVYLTDVFKVWVCNPERLYNGIQLPKVDKKKFVEILEAELDAVNPVAIVTWGRPAGDSVKRLKIGGKHLPFPHPSGAASRAWKKLLQGQSPTHENKLAYWRTSLRQELGTAVQD